MSLSNGDGTAAENAPKPAKQAADKSAAPAASASQECMQTKAQIKVQTSKYYKQITIGVLLFFCFIDVLGQCLFMPAGPVLCQQADGGPIETYAQLLLAPLGSIDYEKFGLSDEFKTLHQSMDTVAEGLLGGAANCPAAPLPCRMGLSPGQTKKLAIETLGNPKAFKEVGVAVRRRLFRSRTSSDRGA